MEWQAGWGAEKGDPYLEAVRPTLAFLKGNHTRPSSVEGIRGPDDTGWQSWAGNRREELSVDGTVTQR